MQTKSLLAAVDQLPTEVRNAIGAKNITGIRSIVHTERKNGDRVVCIRRSGVNGCERWVAGPACSSSWRYEGATTKVKKCW